ncbi:MAG: hypothetical protein ACFHWZ_04865 [Phycisphaerales bacterium]
MIRPRSLARAALLGLCLATAHGATLAQDAPPTAQNAALENEITPALNQAVTNGLEALAQLQRDDGSFGGQRYGSNAAITGLAALAFMADGNMPGRGQYSEQVERALEFLLNNTNETGLIAGDTSHGPMYGHGFATLFLGEVYGMTAGGDNAEQSRRTHDALVRAVRLIVQTQNEEGGWRYNPTPHDADISVTITQIMALRSAQRRNRGADRDHRPRRRICPALSER